VGAEPPGGAGLPYKEELEGGGGLRRRVYANKSSAGAEPGLLTMRRVHSQVDGHWRNALVGAGDPVGLGLNLQAHLLEVGEFLTLAVQKLGIFCPRSR
jgi:hypothetical protein